MTAKTIVALILAIPTYGISLVLLVVYKLYQAGKSVNALEPVLVQLGDEGTRESTCFREISYLQARTFLEEKGEHVASLNLLHSYLLKHSDGVLLVDLNKEPQGDGAIFRVTAVDWLLDLQKWARAGHLPEKRISLADLFKLESFSDDPISSIGESLLDKEIKALHRDFYKLPFLEKLFVSGESLASLGANIGKMRSLRVLRVNDADSIPSEIGALENLEYLQFNHGRVKHVPEEVRNLKKLEMLEFRENEISCVPASVCQLESLHTVDFRKNRLTSVPDDLTANAHIRYYLLGDNQLESLPCFPRRPNCRTDKYRVDLGFNRFESIPESIFDIDSIYDLILYGNPLKSLPDDLSQLNVKSRLALGEQKDLRLSPNQVSWLKQKEADGCDIWLECDDLVMGDVEEWKSLIGTRKQLGYEPARLFRRPVCLSQAASPDSSS